MGRLLANSILFIFIFVLSANTQAAIPAAERDALLELYNNTMGSGWHNSTNWQGVAGTECSWYGVSCSDDGNSITGLNLKSNNLRGALPGSLINLVNLTTNDLRFNALYSDNNALINFLDSSGPVGSLLDTQTLDPRNVTINNVTANGFTLNWEPVGYQLAGGYRVFLAQQAVDYTQLTEFVQIAEINDKSVTSHTLQGLDPCTPYFVKVSSYTAPHDDNGSEIESNSTQQNVMGTITNYHAGCDGIVIASAGILTMQVQYDAAITENYILIEIEASGDRIYTEVIPGDPPVDPAPCNDEPAGVVIINQGTASEYEVICPDYGNINITAPSLEFGFSPLFVNITYLPELTEIGSGVVTVSAYDPNGEALSYSITGGNTNETFAINSDGQITLANSLDPDVPQYNITLEVANTSGQTDTRTMTVMVVTLEDRAELVNDKDTDKEKQSPADSSAGGCTLHPGASFDPVLLFMLLMAAVYPRRKTRH